MNTLVARHVPACAPARTTPCQVVARPTPTASIPVSSGSWIERLADWAERQPAHRRMGSWVRYR